MLDVEHVLEELGLDVVYDAGKYLVCRCPFTDHSHDDVRPGFFSYADTGHWICFKGCGQGRLQDLVARARRVTSEEARRWLLTQGKEEDSAAVVQALEPRPEEVNTAPREVPAVRADYDRQLADRTSRYILDRGFTLETVRGWEMRYDPEVPAVVIPIYDLTGQLLVGLVRREVVSGAQPAKYMYSPLFERGRYLFGAWRYAGEGRVVLVEGPLDCVWLHQCGVTDAVALMGAYCSVTQQRALARLGTRVTLALDGDRAGHEAAQRLRRQFSSWFAVQTVNLPDGKDVQDLSPERVRQLIGGR